MHFTINAIFLIQLEVIKNSEQNLFIMIFPALWLIKSLTVIKSSTADEANSVF